MWQQGRPAAAIQVQVVLLGVQLQQALLLPVEATVLLLLLLLLLVPVGDLLLPLAVGDLPLLVLVPVGDLLLPLLLVGAMLVVHLLQASVGDPLLLVPVAGCLAVLPCMLVVVVVVPAVVLQAQGVQWCCMTPSWVWGVTGSLR